LQVRAFLTSALNVGEWSASERAPINIRQKAGWAPESVGRGGEGGKKKKIPTVS